MPCCMGERGYEASTVSASISRSSIVEGAHAIAPFTAVVWGSRLNPDHFRRGGGGGGGPSGLLRLQAEQKPRHARAPDDELVQADRGRQRAERDDGELRERPDAPTHHPVGEGRGER